MRWSVLQFHFHLTALAVAAGPIAAQSSVPGGLPARDMVGFGASVVLSGDELYVGRPGEIGFFPMPPLQAGAVHVFAPDPDGTWRRRATVTAATAGIGDAFGQTVAVHGNVLLVGAPQQDGARGGAYVYERWSGDAWSEGGRLVPEGAVAGDGVGSAIALYEGTALVGAPGRNDGRGAVFVFRRDPSTGVWSETAVIAPDSLEPGDRFGAAVGLEGDRAVIGAPGPATMPALVGPSPQPKVGTAYVFRREGTGWRREARIVGSAEMDRALGAAVSLAGTDMLVSAPMADNGRGAVYGYRRDARSGAWRRASTFAPESMATAPLMFGASVARTGADVLVGAPGADGRAGRLYVFRAGMATPVQQMQPENPSLGTSFGAAVAARGNMVVVGAPGGDFFEGTGYVFLRDESSGEWSVSGNVVDESAGLEPIVGGKVECEEGKARLFTCGDVDLVSFLPVSAIGGRRGIQVNDVWGWADSSTGREYAIVGRFDGTSFVDVSDPAHPVYLGDLPMHEGATRNLWRDIKVYKQHAFIVADQAGAHGVQVFDLTQLRDVTSPPVTFRETAHYDGIHSAHNIAIDEATGYAYVVGSSMGGETCGGGLHMIDIRDPRNPVFAGCFADPQTGNAKTGYSHDAMCVVYHGPDVEHQGGEICFGANETALSIADVTDKSNPVPLAAASYPNVVYAHQGWISDDHRYFFMDDEGDEITGVAPRTRTLVWDIEDLDDPVVIKEHQGVTGATDHNLYVRGPYLYQSNYVAGLRILDIRDPANPREVAYFDTVPFGEDAPGFAGSWSNYPFLPSGNVIVTSMREGVFILQQREERLLP